MMHVCKDCWVSCLASLYYSFLIIKMKAVVIGLLENIMRCRQLRIMKTLNTCAFVSMSSEGGWRESLIMVPGQPSGIVNLLAENRAEKQKKVQAKLMFSEHYFVDYNLIKIQNFQYFKTSLIL